MAMLAIPGSSNFVGEFYILTGLFQSKVALALIASVGIALAAYYSLRMYQRTMHNRLPAGAVSREMTLREGIVIAPLVACIVAIALYPALITDRGEASVTQSVGKVAAMTGYAEPEPDAPGAENAASESEVPLAAPGPDDQRTVLRCAQEALEPADSIDKAALNECLTDAGIDPAQTDIPAVGG